MSDARKNWFGHTFYHRAEPAHLAAAPLTERRLARYSHPSDMAILPRSRQILQILLGCTLAATAFVPAKARAEECLYKDNFTGGLQQWIVEQMPGGTVTAEKGVLEIIDEGGCTVWFREKLTAPVVISYEASVVDEGGPSDRVSDLNCFWMATDPRSPATLFGKDHGRTGEFKTYDTLKTYYVGHGGNTNTTTRFRRYSGTGERPLLPENDLTIRLVPNHTYHIELTARDGVATYRSDGKLIFEFKDPEFLSQGWFGFRTVKAHLRIRNFCVRKPTAPDQQAAQPR